MIEKKEHTSIDRRKAAIAIFEAFGEVVEECKRALAEGDPAYAMEVCRCFFRKTQTFDDATGELIIRVVADELNFPENIEEILDDAKFRVDQRLAPVMDRLMNQMIEIVLP